MNKSLVTLVLILILVVVIVAASIFIMKGKSAEDDRSGDPIVTPAPPRETESPSGGGESGGSGQVGGAEAPIATREPLATPAPIPASTPAPAPTPAPTPKPTPIPADASGSFSSNTGTGLNLRVDWQTYKDGGGSRKLKADVYIVSYSIFTSAQYRSITLKVGSNAWGADCAGISYDGKDQIATKAASFTVDAPAPGSTVSVEWYYGGSYSGKELHTITATGTVG